MRYCLTLDLKDDPALIKAYKMYHQQVWPEILASIKQSGITEMHIYHIDTRLMMIMETNEDFSFETKKQMDSDNKKVQEWEQLMDTYQKRLPFAQADEKWVLMEKIFEL